MFVRGILQHSEFSSTSSPPLSETDALAHVHRVLAHEVPYVAVWLRQEQIAELFSKDRTGVGRHIAKIFAEGEIDSESNVQKMHIPFSDKPVAFYSLDVILAVGQTLTNEKNNYFSTSNESSAYIAQSSEGSASYT